MTIRKINEKMIDPTLVQKVNDHTALLAEKPNRAEVDTKVAQIVSGAPKGTYATLSALQSAKPTGDTGTYIVIGSNGVSEVDTLTVTAIPTTAGNVTVTLNGIAKTVAIDSATDTTTTLVATKIRAATYTGWTTGGTGSTITFTKTTIGTNTAPIFSAGSTGSVATFAITTVGVAVRSSDWYYWNGSSWTNGGVYQSTGIAEGSVSPTKTSFVKEVNLTANLFNKDTIIPNGYFSLGSNTWTVDAGFHTSDYIDVTEGQKYNHIQLGYVHFYNASFVRVTYVNATNLPYIDIPVGQGIRYMRITIRSVRLETEMLIQGEILPTIYEPYSKKLKIVNVGISQKDLVFLKQEGEKYSFDSSIIINSKHELSGLKWNAIGDSITFGQGATQPYAGIIAGRTGILPTNYGVSGSRITTADDRTDSIVSRYSAMSNDADIITVMGGTNDAGYNMPMGVWGDTVDTTFYGALSILIEGLLLKYPSKRIGFITPIPRINNPYPTSKLNTYVTTIKDVCNRYSIPVLDLHTGSGLSANFAAHKDLVMPDGVHPNDMGQEIISRKIQAFLMRI